MLLSLSLAAYFTAIREMAGRPTKAKTGCLRFPGRQRVTLAYGKEPGRLMLFHVKLFYVNKKIFTNNIFT
jgi:hypothetical protein